jgi:dTDP-4-dehydrorhamnose reductase
VTRVLVTGGGGQLGRSIADLVDEARFAHLDVHIPARAALDLGNPTQVQTALAEIDPEVIINAAAYTNVDRAEDELRHASNTNAGGAGLLAGFGLRLIHLSTDFVFDGAKDGWYVEDDATAPLGHYGRTKARGEAAIRAQIDNHLILRTSWLYSAHGHNFVKTMLRLATDNTNMRVVADQVGCPTSAHDLADALLRLVDTDCRGTFHLAGTEEATWHEFAVGIVEAAGIDVKIEAIATTEYPTRAPRPANSRLDSTAIADTIGIRLPGWRTSLPAVIEQIQALTD